MNTPEPELIQFSCPTCKFKIEALPHSSVYCPNCHKWLKGKPNNKLEIPPKAKPYFTCSDCGESYRAESNRQKYCSKCQKSVKKSQTRNRVKKHRQNNLCNALEGI